MFPMVQDKNFEIILSFFDSPLYGIMLAPPSIYVKAQASRRLPPTPLTPGSELS